MKHAIAFIIVSYHPDLLKLKSLLAALESQYVIIVDNSRSLRPNDAPKTTRISPVGNSGYGGGANIGIRHASGRGSQWFVILNQDVVASKESIKAFVTEVKKCKSGIVGPFSGALDPKRWTTIFPSEKTAYVSGSMIAVHTSVVSKIGYFYEPYFMYYEEVDYCVRAKSGAGFPITGIHIPGIAHDDSRSLGKGSKAHEYYLARNHAYFVRRLAPNAVKWYELLRTPLTVYEMIRSGKFGAVRGLWDVCLGRTGKARYAI